MFGRNLKRIFSFLKKKIDLSFLNAAGVLSLSGIIVITLCLNKLVQEDPRTNAKLTADTYEPRAFTCIKPFTSLVGFNWKFNKESKRRGGDAKDNAISFPIIHF